ncbi:MAG TPA: carboxypeptidase-like regulatory domain-containing protein [Anaerolineae bacterium]|nr:carboxypeptidase-like regulatory domain-containing protein [Anaerolineae bacterium]
MLRQLKPFVVVLILSIALTATAFSAFALSSNLGRADAVLASPAAQGGACSRMQASDVAWVTLDEDDNIDEQVESYPSDATTIVPLFEYNCVPKKTSIVSVFTLDGEQVYSDKESLKASNSEGFYAYPLGTTDDSPMDEGEWGVEFYNNKTLLSSGVVFVGGDDPTPDTVTVIGTVKDAKTKKAIKGAVILVLVPDVTVEAFIDNDQQDEDIYTAAKTDSKGQYELESPLEREVPYSFIVVAKGYKPIGEDGVTIPADAEDPVELPITLTK